MGHFYAKAFMAAMLFYTIDQESRESISTERKIYESNVQRRAEMKDRRKTAGIPVSDSTIFLRPS